MYRRPLQNTPRRAGLARSAGEIIIWTAIRSGRTRFAENLRRRMTTRTLDCNPLAQRTHKVRREPSSSDDDQTTATTGEAPSRPTAPAHAIDTKPHHRRSTVEANCTRARHRHQAAPPERNTIKATAPPQAFAATPARHHLLSSPPSHGVIPTTTTGGTSTGVSHPSRHQEQDDGGGDGGSSLQR